MKKGKLFKVDCQLQSTICILADDSKHAQEMVGPAGDIPIDKVFPTYEPSTSISEIQCFSQIPSDWTHEEPYGEEEGRSCHAIVYDVLEEEKRQRIIRELDERQLKFDFVEKS